MTRRSVLILAVIALVGVLAGAQTWAAYDATTTNSANSFVSGTVALTDNDSGTALLSLTGATPGLSDTGCIKVSYAGSLAAGVRIYRATTAGTGLGTYLDLKVTRGSFPGTPAFDDCATFVADAPNYIGQGAGVIFNGTVATFPTSGAPLVDLGAVATPESWTGSESHVYKLQVTLQNNALAEGKSDTETFTWQAQNT
jgi:hypothetical protein